MPEPTIDQVVVEPPAKLVLDADQQAHVNKLIAEARERAAKDLKVDLAAAKRAEAALKIEVEALRQLQVPQTDAELISTQERLRAAELEVSTVRADLQASTASIALQTAVSAGGFVNSAQAAKLLRDEAASTDGSAASLAQLVSRFASENPHLVRSDIKGGAGSIPSQGTPAPERINVSSIFGPRSNASLANRLAQTNLAEYKRLKVIAQQSGLIG